MGRVGGSFAAGALGAVGSPGTDSAAFATGVSVTSGASIVTSACTRPIGRSCQRLLSCSAFTRASTPARGSL